MGSTAPLHHRYVRSLAVVGIITRPTYGPGSAGSGTDGGTRHWTIHKTWRREGCIMRRALTPLSTAPSRPSRQVAHIFPPQPPRTQTSARERSNAHIKDMSAVINRSPSLAASRNLPRNAPLKSAGRKTKLWAAKQSCLSDGNFLRTVLTAAALCDPGEVVFSRRLLPLSVRRSHTAARPPDSNPLAALTAWESAGRRWRRFPTPRPVLTLSAVGRAGGGGGAAVAD